MLEICIALSLASGTAWGQTQEAERATPQDQDSSTKSEPGPEMKKLLTAFAGTWSSVEKVEHNDLSPNHGGRKGLEISRPGPGGRSLIKNYSSTGSAGDLRMLIVVWWDQKSQVYRFFTCDNYDACEVRGTARWENENFVNAWEEDIHGEKIHFRDTFTHITPTSYTLISEGRTDNGAVKWLVTSQSTRQSATNQ